VERAEKSSQLIDTLLMFQRALLDNEELKASPSNGKWRQVDRLWGVLQTLIDFGAEVNGTDGDGNTVLCSLIEFGAPLTLIQSAIEKGARVNPSERERQAPLMLAVEQGRADVAELLLDAGANPNGGLSAQSRWRWPEPQAESISLIF
jgi:ankyrin repeat protein